MNTNAREVWDFLLYEALGICLGLLATSFCVSMGWL